MKEKFKEIKVLSMILVLTVLLVSYLFISNTASISKILFNHFTVENNETGIEIKNDTDLFINFKGINDGLSKYNTNLLDDLSLEIEEVILANSNQSKMNSRSGVTKIYKDGSASISFSPLCYINICSVEESAVHHEIAHYIINQLEQSDLKAIEDISITYKHFNKTNTKRVSKYAKTSNEEDIAEVWSYYMTNNNIPKFVPNYEEKLNVLIKHFNKYLVNEIDLISVEGK